MGITASWGCIGFLGCDRRSEPAHGFLSNTVSQSFPHDFAPLYAGLFLATAPHPSPPRTTAWMQEQLPRSSLEVQPLSFFEYRRAGRDREHIRLTVEKSMPIHAIPQTTVADKKA